MPTAALSDGPLLASQADSYMLSCPILSSLVGLCGGLLLSFIRRQQGPILLFPLSLSSRMGYNNSGILNISHKIPSIFDNISDSEGGIYELRSMVL